MRAKGMMSWSASHVGGLMAGVALLACSAGKRLPAVPTALVDQAEVPGMPGIRTTSDLTVLQGDFVEGVQRERDALSAAGHMGPLPPAQYLALSGGSDNGAFGAGILVGWTAAGTRPEFKAVTGISTGALIAPFAFLGSKYDAELKAIYTGILGKGHHGEAHSRRRAVGQCHG